MRTDEQIMPASSLLLVNPSISPLAPYRNSVTLGLAHLAAFEARRREVRIIDMEFSGLSTTEAAEVSDEYDVTGITAMSFQLNGALSLARAIKKKHPGKIVILGGTAPSAMPGLCLRDGFVDAVCIGEGEYALSMIMDQIDSCATVGGVESSGLSSNPAADLKAGSLLKNRLHSIPGLMVRGSSAAVPGRRLEMDSIPFPLRRLLPSTGIIPKDPVFDGQPSAVLMFSRGCPFDCCYCAVPDMWGRKTRRRIPSEAVREIMELKSETGICNLAIEDDCFTSDKSWTEEFCRLVRRVPGIRFRVNSHGNTIDPGMISTLAAAGCAKVTYGVESASEHIRRIAGKVLDLEHLEEMIGYHKKTGLPAATLMMIGLPGETLATVRENLSWLERVKPNGGFDFQIAQPHPGSRLARIAPSYGRIISEDPDDYFSDHVTFVPDGFTPEDFARLCADTVNRVIRIAGSESAGYIPRDGADIEHTAISAGLRIGEIFEIRPEEWTRVSWKGFGGHWQGSVRCRSGLGFVKADGAGKIIYTAILNNESIRSAGKITEEKSKPCNYGSNNKDTGIIFMTARLSSHHFVWPEPPEGASMVEVQINGMVAARRLVHSVHTTGKRHIFHIPSWMCREGENEISFRVPDGSYCNGLAIFTDAINQFFACAEEGIRITSSFRPS